MPICWAPSPRWGAPPNSARAPRRSLFGPRRPRFCPPISADVVHALLWSPRPCQCARTDGQEIVCRDARRLAPSRSSASGCGSSPFPAAGQPLWAFARSRAFTSSRGLLPSRCNDTICCDALSFMSRTSHETSNLPQGGERQRHAAAGEPGAGRLRAKSAAGADRAGTPAKGNSGQADQAAAGRPRRVRRPLCRRRRHRGARARLGLPRRHPLQGWPTRQKGRPALYHRSTALRGLTGPGRGKPGAGARQSGLRRGRSGARPGSGARQHHYATNLRSAHAGQARRRGLGQSPGGGGAPGQPRSRIHRVEGTDHGTDRRPASFRGQSRHRRHYRQHDAACHHHLDRPNPLRIHHGRDLVFAFAAARRRGVGQRGARRPSGQTQTDRRAQVFPHR